MSSKDIEAMRHSCAHILASSVQRLWPKAKFGVGPVVENGFYYDIDLDSTKVSELDFPKIEKEMSKIIKENQKFEKTEVDITKAVDWARNTDQPYKLELLNDLMREGTTLASELDSSMVGLPAGIVGATSPEVEIGKVSFYKNGDFVDLCRGPHLESTGRVGHFKLLKISGAFWRGKDTNPQMQRIYGVAFGTKKELDDYLVMVEEAKRRDHRKISKELDLYVMSSLVGAGLPLFTPRGTIIRDQLGGFSQEIQSRYGYEKVMIPHLTRSELYKASGHYEKYPEKFIVTSEESSDEFLIKPMSCPHHTQIYASKPRSYRDLPIRYMENTQVYRDEKSGELHGLSRVRMITQDDSHCFCTDEQVGEELSNIVEMVRQMYKVLNMEYRAVLSFRDDGDKYLGDIKTWERAEKSLEQTVKSQKIEYEICLGEAAFYGPKVDFMVKDALGREWQCATLQLDFLQPKRLNLEYTDARGEKQTPVMIHKALLGSIERFMSVYLEHTNGKLPVWLAPEQIRVATLNQEPKIVEFAEALVRGAKEVGLRASLDNASESVGKKIREAEMWKIPYTVVVGPKEVETGCVNPRTRQDLTEGSAKSVKIDEFLKTVKDEVSNRLTKSTV